MRGGIFYSLQQKHWLFWINRFKVWWHRYDWLIMIMEKCHPTPKGWLEEAGERIVNEWNMEESSCRTKAKLHNDVRYVTERHKCSQMSQSQTKLKLDQTTQKGHVCINILKVKVQASLWILRKSSFSQVNANASVATTTVFSNKQRTVSFCLLIIYTKTQQNSND